MTGTAELQTAHVAHLRTRAGFYESICARVRIALVAEVHVASSRHRLVLILQSQGSASMPPMGSSSSSDEDLSMFRSVAVIADDIAESARKEVCTCSNGCLCSQVSGGHVLDAHILHASAG